MTFDHKQIFFKSPSLTIVKPNLNSIFSIFNRLFGIILVLICLLIYCVVFFNYHTFCVFNYSVLVNDWFPYILKNVVSNYLLHFLIYHFFTLFLAYHLIYSSFKIFTKVSKIYQIISSKIIIIDKLYFFIIINLSIFFGIFIMFNFIKVFVFTKYFFHFKYFLLILAKMLIVIIYILFISKKHTQKKEQISEDGK